MRKEPLPIVGRTPTIRQILRRVRQELPGAIGTGDSGVGKTAIAKEIARLMVYEPEKLPKEVRGHRVVSVDSSLVKGQEGHQFTSGMQKSFNDLLNDAAKPKDGVPVLLVFDEFHQLIGGGTSVGNPNGMEETFKTFMEKNPHVKILGFTTTDEYAKHVAGNEALTRRFGKFPIHIEQLEKRDALEATLNAARELEKKYDLIFPKKVIKKAAEQSDYYFAVARPGNAINFLESTAIMIKDQMEYGERSESKNKVTIKDLEQNLRVESNIPMVGKNFRNTILGMEDRLKKRVFGQDHAIKEIVNAYKNRFAFQNLDGPIGSFLLAGDTGTGKTELAKAVSEAVTGEENLVRIDLGNIKDITQIIGRPGELGLAHKVASQPFSVVLLDEIDQASEPIRKLFYAAIDDGYMRDFQGKKLSLIHI